MNMQEMLLEKNEPQSLCHARVARDYPSLTDSFMQSVASTIAGAGKTIPLFFGKLTTNDEWNQLGRFRRANYASKKPYMVAELDEKGLDRFDNSSIIYAAWLRDEMVASIRLCAYPFESCQFIESEKLRHFLGDHYQTQYLEWSRLLVSHTTALPRLLPAIIIYAGMQTLATSDYHHYFGYSTPVVKRLFSRFLLSNGSLEFTIPHRGGHPYHLLKGDFLEDFIHLSKKGFQ
ncbi:hypothetical protein [Aquicella lusitana]|uniref:N-acyl amino acid synthase of PEP-CTERM/exosortase system n=1 Tax=Aquicella lusitana TaxID=254246 RepID=A0A370GYS1_9COXI|nr:hypothetical protein [Aquicella lusitana]RDI48649.1 hypothetical protein C8D86_10277 [Aquicella lusitana]VVC73974.1 hypothetical protein AQULUS_17360 [Aquicella lusitana]